MKFIFSRNEYYSKVVFESLDVTSKKKLGKDRIKMKSPLEEWRFLSSVEKKEEEKRVRRKDLNIIDQRRVMRVRTFLLWQREARRQET